jgi:hypothetical protein
MEAVDPDRFVFLDESHAKTTMTRRYGRAPRGERVVDHVPAGKYHSTTMLGALRYCLGSQFQWNFFPPFCERTPRHA